MQSGSLLLGGDVKPTPAREYGRTTLRVLDSDKLFAGLPSESVVWNSHGDQVNAISEEFHPARPDRHVSLRRRAAPRPPSSTECSSIPKSRTRRSATTSSSTSLRAVCGCSGDWQMAAFIESAVAACREKVGDGHVICGLSGGVDPPSSPRWYIKRSANS